MKIINQGINSRQSILISLYCFLILEALSMFFLMPMITAHEYMTFSTTLYIVWVTLVLIFSLILGISLFKKLKILTIILLSFVGVFILGSAMITFYIFLTEY
jgi:hypothetical protein